MPQTIPLSQKPVIALKALIAGRRFAEKSGLTIAFDVNNRLGVIMVRKNQEEIFLQDWSLNWFMGWSESLSDEEIMECAAFLTLNKEKQDDETETSTSG